MLAEWTERLFPLAQGFLGMEAAVSFQQFVKEYERVVSAEDILDHGRIELTEGFSINEHMALVEKIRESSLLKNDIGPDRALNIAKYFMELPSEIAVALWNFVAESGDGENNATRMHEMKVDGKSAALHFIELIDGAKSS